MSNTTGDDFITELESLLKSARESIDSAMMSDDFIKEANRLLDEIPNLKDAFKVIENDVDSSDAT